MSSNTEEQPSSNQKRRKCGMEILKFVALLLLSSVISSVIAIELCKKYCTVPGPSEPVLQNNSSKISRISPERVRLPRSVLPIHYTVCLLPYFEDRNFTFEGSVEILVHCEEDTNTVTLHGLDITVNESSIQVLNYRDNRSIATHGFVQHPASQLLVIDLGDELLRKGQTYTVSMEYRGFLNDDMKGLYRSSYEENGEKKWLASTQFQATDVRRAFPCFDEPNMKAEFTMIVGRKQTMSSLSNMPLDYTTEIIGKPGYKWDHFKRSLPMSTYLVATVVSEFSHVVINTAKPLMRIWTRPSAINQTKYASEMATRVFDYMQGYLEVPYPMDKLDLIAVPDFPYGAMENWGLITFRESALLVDEFASSTSNKQRVVTVITHEMAHNWFGNLVTIDWWSNMFINEGLASYFTLQGVDEVEPGLRIFESSVADDTLPLLVQDALSTAQPLSVPANHSDEINSGLLYRKGPALLRMLKGFLGAETFRKGMVRYLKKYQYKNTVEEDLWQSITDQSIEDGIDIPTTVNQIMQSWMKNEGFPLVSVIRDYENNGTMLIKQNRFLVQNRSNSTYTSIKRWWIPLTFTADFSTVQTSWIPETKDKISMKLDGILDDSWIIFNINSLGYYRVNYDQKNWELIHQQLLKDHAKIPAVNRAQLIDDAFNIARNGLLDYKVPLKLIEYLSREMDYVPWKAALNALDYVKVMLQGNPVYGSFQAYVRTKIQPFYENFGFDENPDDEHSVVTSRSFATQWACRYGLADCVANAKQLYGLWMSNHSSNVLAENLKPTVACTAIEEGGELEWNFAYERYKQSNVPAEKDGLLKAMACSRNPEILEKLLEWSLDSSAGIRKQDGATVFAQVARKPWGRAIALSKLTKRWDHVNTYFPVVSEKAGILDAIGDGLNSRAQLEDFRRFGDSREFGSMASRIAQCLDKTELNVYWMENHLTRISEFLSQ